MNGLCCRFVRTMPGSVVAGDSTQLAGALCWRAREKKKATVLMQLVAITIVDYLPNFRETATLVVASTLTKEV